VDRISCIVGKSRHTNTDGNAVRAVIAWRAAAGYGKHMFLDGRSDTLGSDDDPATSPDPVA